MTPKTGNFLSNITAIYIKDNFLEKSRIIFGYHIQSSLPVQALVPCDLMENPLSEAVAADAQLHVKPFEVQTYRVKL